MTHFELERESKDYEGDTESEEVDDTNSGAGIAPAETETEAERQLAELKRRFATLRTLPAYKRLTRLWFTAKAKPVSSGKAKDNDSAVDSDSSTDMSETEIDAMCAAPQSRRGSAVSKKTSSVSSAFRSGRSGGVFSSRRGRDSRSSRGKRKCDKASTVSVNSSKEGSEERGDEADASGGNEATPCGVLCLCEQLVHSAGAALIVFWLAYYFYLLYTLYPLSNSLLDCITLCYATSMFHIDSLYKGVFENLLLYTGLFTLEDDSWNLVYQSRHTSDVAMPWIWDADADYLKCESARLEETERFNAANGYDGYEDNYFRTGAFRGRLPPPLSIDDGNPGTDQLIVYDEFGRSHVFSHGKPSFAYGFRDALHYASVEIESERAAQKHHQYWSSPSVSPRHKPQTVSGSQPRAQVQIQCDPVLDASGKPISIGGANANRGHGGEASNVPLPKQNCRVHVQSVGTAAGHSTGKQQRVRGRSRGHYHGAAAMGTNSGSLQHTYSTVLTRTQAEREFALEVAHCKNVSAAHLTEVSLVRGFHVVCVHHFPFYSQSLVTVFQHGFSKELVPPMRVERYKSQKEPVSVYGSDSVLCDDWFPEGNTGLCIEANTGRTSDCDSMSNNAFSTLAGCRFVRTGIRRNPKHILVTWKGLRQLRMHLQLHLVDDITHWDHYTKYAWDYRSTKVPGVSTALPMSPHFPTHLPLKPPRSSLPPMNPTHKQRLEQRYGKNVKFTDLRRRREILKRQRKKKRRADDDLKADSSKDGGSDARDERRQEYRRTPFGLYTPKARSLRIGDPQSEQLLEEGATEGRVLYLFEGGNFMWPGIRRGHKIHIPLTGVLAKDIGARTPSLAPNRARAKNPKLSTTTTTSSSSSQPSKAKSSKEWSSKKSSSKSGKKRSGKKKKKKGTKSEAATGNVPKGGLELGSGVGTGEVLTLTTLNMRPLVFEVSGLLTEGECQQLIETATPRLQRSEVGLNMEKKTSEARTCFGTWLFAGEHVVVEALKRRVSRLLQVSANFMEDVEVIRYTRGQKFDVHFDAFQRSDAPTDDLLHGGLRNRLATVLYYLTEYDGSGHTVFPRHDGNRVFRPLFGAEVERDGSELQWAQRGCNGESQALFVRPKKGKAILFYDLLANGDVDVAALHGGCNVSSIKWAANQWVWNRPFK